MAFEDGSGDAVIVFVGDRTAFSLASVLEGVLLFDGCWREGDPVWKRKQLLTLILHQLSLFAQENEI